MRIELEKLSKRYDREWIIRSFSYVFESGNCYGVNGRNGAGKSTLLRILSGHLTPSRGRITFSADDKVIATEDLYPHLSLVGPYIDLIEELTLTEAIDFHFQFKKPRPGIDKKLLPDLLELNKYKKLKLNQFSSGMKQRVALGLALFADTELLLLDEPTTTLDREAREWFQQNLAKQQSGRLVVIATNVEDDLQNCNHLIDMATVRGEVK
ncbi:ABC transporter ATP-binding protein [Lewinellaceae bacterium SD302]|nr:ABC transporter ATP-binding protein [Lewinellaceae bacterium SD302]